MKRSRDNAKNKLYRNQNKERILIAKTAKRAHYVLTEPKTDVKEKYVQNIKTKIHSKPTLKLKLLHAFGSSRKPLADKIEPSKLCNAVSNIEARKLLNKVLKVRKQSVGELLSCIRSVTALKFSPEDLVNHATLRPQSPSSMTRVTQWSITFSPLAMGDV